MNEQEKQLLLKDLCARLPYNPWVLVEFEGSNQEWTTKLQQEYCVGYISGKITKLYSCEITVKPYLRPLTSMTDMEKQQFNLLSMNKIVPDGFGRDIQMFSLKCIDWLNAHHFDFRGLIEKGLALEALEGMYD